MAVERHLREAVSQAGAAATLGRDGHAAARRLQLRRVHIHRRGRLAADLWGDLRRHVRPEGGRRPRGGERRRPSPGQPRHRPQPVRRQRAPLRLLRSRRFRRQLPGVQPRECSRPWHCRAWGAGAGCPVACSTVVADRGDDCRVGRDVGGARARHDAAGSGRVNRDPARGCGRSDRRPTGVRGAGGRLPSEKGQRRLRGAAPG
jgi:hypothetical protein